MVPSVLVLAAPREATAPVGEALRDAGADPLFDLRGATPAAGPSERLPLALVAARPGEERAAVEAGLQAAHRVLVEAGSFEVALRAAEAGADGIVATGSEAGGVRSTFILLQELSGRLAIPFWARGGIGPATAAAAVVAGASGVVLEPGLASARSPSAARDALASVRSAMRHLPSLAASQPTLEAGSPWAAQHGVPLPIVQGPMTRVSDTPAFARAVADGGALPCLALGALGGAAVRELLAGTAALLGGRPFGVGLLGFAPRALRDEQLAEVLAAKPPLAVVAGGRPEQATELERAGIAAYLHAPSPELARLFVEAGARRLVLEGREAGGHVGPRTSFELWQQAVDALLNARLADPATLSVLLAGGIHDALSAAMAATVAAPLVAAGVKVGFLVGSAYLLTREATGTGALTRAFQEQALACRETTLLVTGPAWVTRCAPTPYCGAFEGLRASLLASGAGTEAVARELEAAHVGRLRLAAKGVRRDEAGALVTAGEEEQLRDGLYMLGEAATLRSEVTTIEALHADLTDGAAARLRAHRREAGPTPPAEPVAIVGMACLLPGAGSLRAYWDNVLGRVEAIRDADPARFVPGLLDDPARNGRGGPPAARGGFLDPVLFDPARYGIPPASVPAIEPVQLIALEVAARALADAGPAAVDPYRDRCAVVVGIGGAHDLGNDYAFRTLLPQHLLRDGGLPAEAREALVARLGAGLPEWTEDSFPGFLGNVVAGRIASRLDLHGPSFTVDAACASSLAALDVALRMLRTRASDMAVVGAVDGTNHAPGYVAFASTHALSPTGRCRPFDESADGTVISEGAAMLVLKRLEDAEADGDRVWAVLRGTGASSDGRSTSLTAPHAPGQRRALERAYLDAGVDPRTVGLLEAHGTGTRVGDPVEVEALHAVFAGGERRGCALGSVKSAIGHTKVVAGLAGLLKAALALHERVLPPTLGIERPNRAVDWSSSPFFLCTEARPWLGSPGRPRRAGVSAFGFGGSNFHAVLEEAPRSSAVRLGSRPAEVVAFSGNDPGDLRARLASALSLLDGEGPELPEVAAAITFETARRGPAERRLAVVARSLPELRARIGLALDDPLSTRAADGLFAGGGEAPGGLAVVFPGQGVQRVGMLGDLLVGTRFLESRLEAADALLAAELPDRPSRLVHPLPALSAEERASAKARLDATDVAQPALACVQMAAWDLLRSLGVAPAALAGHSFGEYTALWAAGAMTDDELLLLAARRGRLCARAGDGRPGSLAAVPLARGEVEGWVAKAPPGLSIAAENGPRQTVVGGPTPAVEELVRRLHGDGIAARTLPVGAAFHTPHLAEAARELATALASVPWRAPSVPVLSGTLAAPHAIDPAALAGVLGEHLVRPLRFLDGIRALHDAGVRVFVDAGPGATVAGLVSACLEGRPHESLALDPPDAPGWPGAARLVARLFAIGCPVRPEAWFDGRDVRCRSLDEVLERCPGSRPTPTAWRIAPGRAEPLAGGRPSRPRPPAADVPIELPRPAGTRPTATGKGPASLAPAADPLPPAEAFSRRLVEAVSAATGYPVALLDADASLEGDLGVDSIKRLEVLMALPELRELRRRHGDPDDERVLTALGRLTSIRRIVAWYEAERRALPAAVEPVAPALAPVPADEGDPLARFEVATVPSPLERAAPPRRGLTALVVGEPDLLAGELAAALRREGWRVREVADGDRAASLGDHRFECDARSFRSAGELRRLLLSHGDAPSALFNLLPLRGATRRPWTAGEHARSLLSLLRAFGPGLATEGRAGWLVNVTGLDGAFGLARGEEVGPSGTHGVARTAGRERAGLRVTCVDVDLSLDAAHLASALVAELAARRDGIPVDVGLGSAGRVQVVTDGRAAPTREPREDGARLALPDDAVILATGGGAGITAAILSGLVSSARSPRVVVVGRSDLGSPEGEDPAGPVDEGGLRRLLVERAVAEGRPPASVEAELAATLRRREVRRNLEALAARGAQVRYERLDVADEAAFEALVRRLYRELGRIDGVVHGAGVVRDRLVGAKTRADFDRVFATKVVPALALERALEPETLRFVLFLSSVAGRFGNVGQADYAAANQVLSALSWRLSRLWPHVRTLSVDLGPWEGGMVGDGLRRLYLERGVRLIPVEEGVRRCLSELLGPGPPEVVLTRSLPAIASYRAGSFRP